MDMYLCVYRKVVDDAVTGSHCHISGLCNEVNSIRC
jgi:hypothetical protein